MKKLCLFLLLAAILSFSRPVFAEEKPEPVRLIGVGAIMSSDIYKDVDNDPVPVPVLNIKYKRFFISGKNMGFIIDETKTRRLDIFLEPRFMGYDSDEGNFLNGMEDRDYSLDAGIQIRQNISYPKNTYLSLGAKTDILDKSNGQELSLKYGYLHRHKYFSLTPSVGVKWQSKDLVDYYYGVRSSEVAASRPEYTPDSTVNYTAGVALNFGLSKRWLVVVGVEYELFGDDIKDSPIVDKDYSVSGLLGLAMMF